MKRMHLLSVLAAGVFVVACSSSKPDGSGATGTNKSKTTGTAGAGKKDPSAAKKAGQKVGKTAMKDEKKSEDKGKSYGGGGGSSGGGKKKNGGAHSAEAAEKAGEKVAKSGKASHDKSKASDKGTTFQSVECDDSHELLGFCGDETHVDFCMGGHWYALDCDAAEGGAFCGEDVSAQTVDCYVDADFASSGEGDAIECDDEMQGVAFCSDDDHAVWCDNGHWHALDCGEVEDGAHCEESSSIHVVDCAVDGAELVLYEEE